MSGNIPFAREFWIAVNPYSMDTDGRHTLTLDGKPSPGYTPERTIAYIDKWENDSGDLGIGGSFYCIKANATPPPDVVSTLVEALNARARGRWLTVVRRAVREHTLLLWDQQGRLLDDRPYTCICGLGATTDIASVRCDSGAEIREAT